MQKRQIIAFLMALLAGNSASEVAGGIYDNRSDPTGTLWTGLAQMPVSDSNLYDSSLKGLPNLTSALLGDKPGDPNLAGLPGSAGTRELFIKMMVSVVLVIVLGGIAIYGSKRLAGKLANMPGKRIRIVETAHLGPKKAVHLLRIGDRCILIGSTNDNITKIADLTTEIVMEEKAASLSGESHKASQPDSATDFSVALESSDALADLSRTYAENN